ncbi:MAG: class I SAM-dependent methyltransferase [Chloroflexi bacterium]|nr:class I SAM-dependent methyltransferase [Chloroflexota bacterium]
MATIEPKSIALGHPSYVWRFGQDRRLNLVRSQVNLDGKRILDVGCGIGTYTRKFRLFSSEVYGVDVDHERAQAASQNLTNIIVAPAEALPYPDDYFDVVFLHEVIEHVSDDRKAISEAIRVVASGGHVILFAPNRLYPFETHGIYLGRKYIFKLIPFVNYLPDRLRRVFCPHVRAYTRRDLDHLFAPLPARISYHTCVYPGFDNIVGRYRRLGHMLRQVLYFFEGTPLHVFGLSHFVVADKTSACPPRGQ